MKSAYKNEFFDHINSVDQYTRFPVESTRADGSMPFLDTLVMTQPDGTLATTVYGKPTHTDLHLGLSFLLCSSCSLHDLEGSFCRHCVNSALTFCELMYSYSSNKSA